MDKAQTPNIYAIVFGALLLSCFGYWLLVSNPNHNGEQDKHRFDYQSAAPYTIIGMEEDFSFPGRQRETWWVRTTAKSPTPTQALDTAKKAAIEIKTRTRADVLQVWLINSDNNKDGIASVFYAPDGKGRSGEESWTWDVGYLIGG